MTTSDWATQQLAEFLAVLTAAADEKAAIGHALERLAESFGADAGAFVRDGQVMSSLGWMTGDDHAAELIAVVAGQWGTLHVPGAGQCETVVVPVDRDKASTLVLARAARRFSAEEAGLLRGMARVLALGLRLLATVAVERKQAEENVQLVSSLRERQSLLEKLSAVQRQISKRGPLQDVLDAITSGAAELVLDVVVALHLVDDSAPEFMATVSSAGAPAPLAPGRVPVGTGLSGRAIAEDGLCLVERDDDALLGAIGLAGLAELRSGMAAPVDLEGRTVGSLVVASPRAGRTYRRPERDVVTAFAELVGLALNDARSVQAMNQALGDARHQAMFDELTDLPNRACFYDRTDQALRLAARDLSSTAVLLFDLNRFKEINDTLGHKFGDRVLTEIGPRLRRGLRVSDTLARLGGDEFAVLLPCVSGPGFALDVAERLLSLLEEPFDIDGMSMAVEASCGVAIAPIDGDTADLLLQRADVAMYVAKESHGRVVAYNDELNINTRARLALLGELRAAIGQDQFVLFYQPKAQLGCGTIEGVEALVRWQHPTLGLVPPTISSRWRSIPA